MVLKQLKLNAQKLRNWSKCNPMSNLDKIYFLKYEIAAVHSDLLKDIANYEESTSLSKKHGLRNEEVIAREKARMFYPNLNRLLSLSQNTFRAYQFYDDQGTKVKINQLTKKHPLISVEFKNSLNNNFTGTQLTKESEASASLILQ